MIGHIFKRVAAALACSSICVGVSPALGETYTVRAGFSLQAAIDIAQPGDTLLLEQGATFVGPIVLKAKSGTGTDADWIVVRTSLPDDRFVAQGTRATAADASLMAKVVAPGADQPAISTEAGAHHYRLIGLEITSQSETSVVRELVRLGDGSSAQNTLASVPHHLVIERCYVHAVGLQEMVRGIALNSASTSILDSTVSNIKSTGFDSQALWGWNGPGPFEIINNYLEASGENAGFGGADPAIAGLVPSDIRFLRNHCNKPMTWRDGPWLVKNLFELKNAQNVIIEGNLFENNWAGGQAGFAVLFTVRNQSGTAPWSTIRNLTFRSNIVRTSASGVAILGTDDQGWPSTTADNILIENNLFYDIRGAGLGGDGNLLQIGGKPSRLTVVHNTFDLSASFGSVILVYGEPTTGFSYSDNIVTGGLYSIIGPGLIGNTAVAALLPGAAILGNVLAGQDSSSNPLGNYYPSVTLAKAAFQAPATGDYSLSSDSPLKGKANDGGDPGIDWRALMSASRGPSAPPSSPRNILVKQ